MSKLFDHDFVKFSSKIEIQLLILKNNRITADLKKSLTVKDFIVKYELKYSSS